MEGCNDKLLNVWKEAVLVHFVAPRKTSFCTACLRDEFEHRYFSNTDKRCKPLDRVIYLLHFTQSCGTEHLLSSSRVCIESRRVHAKYHYIRTILSFGKNCLKRILCEPD
jgi:hypothetical protein